MHQQSEEWTGHAQTLHLIIMIKKKFKVRVVIKSDQTDVVRDEDGR